MNKAILINQSPNICDNMRNGTQQYMFSNYKFDSGMRVYVNRSNTRFVINEFVIGEVIDIEDIKMDIKADGGGSPYEIYYYQDEKIEDNDIYDLINIIEGNHQGYTNQKYAYEISQLIMYGKDKKGCNFDCQNCIYDDDGEYANCNKPIKPLDISEFMSCKKIDNEWKGYYNAYKECLAFTPLSEEQYKQGIINGIAPSEIRNECKLTNIPTNFVYVVEK